MEATMRTSENRGNHLCRSAVQLAPGLWRTDLQQYDLSLPGREAVQQRVEIGPGASPVRHTGLGEEIIYIIEGSLKYQLLSEELRVAFRSLRAMTASRHQRSEGNPPCP